MYLKYCLSSLLIFTAFYFQLNDVGAPVLAELYYQWYLFVFFSSVAGKKSLPTSYQFIATMHVYSGYAELFASMSWNLPNIGGTHNILLYSIN